MITVKAPALILLSEKDVFDFRVMQKIKAQIMFFKPSAIRDEFTFEKQLKMDQPLSRLWINGVLGGVPELL